MLHRFRIVPLLTLLLAGLALAACSSSDDESANNPSASNDVTLSGSMQVAAATAAVPAGQMLSSNPTDYVLYCVTFTDPPQSGTGSFDATGTFSVTISDAAGLPIGCFINDASTNTPVTTITFQVGTGGGLSDTSGSVALDGGAYDVTIAFDPASGVATVDVSQTTQAPSAATFDPADLVGAWTMSCVDTDPAGDCATFLEGTSIPLYLDVITATQGSETLYAMGAWKGRTEFINLGATEGIDPSQIPTEITGVSSLNTDVTSPAPSATNAFTGFTAQPGYNRPTNQMSGTDVLAALSALSLDYNPNFDDAFGDRCTATSLNLALELDRGCLTGYLNTLSEQGTGNGATVPRVAGSSEQSFVVAGTDGSSLITFQGTQVGNTPTVGARYALMDLQVVGDSGVAQDFNQYTYQGEDPSTQQPVTCEEAEELSIVMTITGANTATGRFTNRRYSSCSNEQRFATFETTFTRQ